MIATIDGRRVGYDDNGYGPPLVLLHGFPHDRSLWSQQRISLASRARCITPDLAGFGESTARESMSMEEYAADVFRLLDHLDIERATIAGLSMGGYIALACWRQYASRIDGLILCDTKAAPDTEEAKAKRNSLIELVDREGVAALVDVQIAGMLGKRTRASNPAIVEYMRAMMNRQSRVAIVAALAALRDRPDSRTTLPTITVPTLVLVGDEDSITPPSEAKALLEGLTRSSNAQLDIIAGAGHASCVERPAAVTHAIADFLAAQAAR